MIKTVLLSIRPKYIEEIIRGEKLYEFRKTLPEFDDIKVKRRIVVYCSKPVKKIIGSFFVKIQHKSDFTSLMNEINATEAYKFRISSYFQKKDICCAVKINDFKLYQTPLSLEYLRNKTGFSPGQNYRYLDEEIISELIRLNGEI